MTQFLIIFFLEKVAQPLWFFHMCLFHTWTVAICSFELGAFINDIITFSVLNRNEKWT